MRDLVRRLGTSYKEGVIRGHQRCHGNTLFTEMAAFRINLGIRRIGFCPSAFFFLLAAHYQLVGKRNLLIQALSRSVSVKDPLFTVSESRYSLLFSETKVNTRMNEQPLSLLMFERGSWNS